MKRERLASAVVTMISIPALGLILHGSASARVTTPRSFSEEVVAINCQGRPQVRPRNFTLACADGNDYLSGLRWTSWGPDLASAIGSQHCGRRAG